MSSNIAAEIKRENDASAALDHEHDELWQQLTKYQLARTNDYTGEILYELNKKKNQVNKLRCNLLSSAQCYVKSLLDSSSSVYETVRSGVSVLLNTICYTEGEVDDYIKRVKKAKEEKMRALDETRKAIAFHKSALEQLRQECRTHKDCQSGLQKLSQLLPRLKMDENANLSVVEQDLQAVTQHISEKSSSADVIQRSIRRLQLKLDETGQYTVEKRNSLQSQSEKIADEKMRLRKLENQKDEICLKLCERRQVLESLLCRSYQEDLSSGANEMEKHERKLADTHLQTTALRSKQLIQRQNWEHVLQLKEIDVASKVSELEDEQASLEEKLHAMMCRLEAFKKHLSDNVEMMDWNEQKRNQVLEDQVELQKRLGTEILEITKKNAEMKECLKCTKDNEDAAEAILSVEQDLMSYLVFYNEQKKQVQEERAETIMKLETVHSKTDALNANNAEKEAEHQSLLNDVKNLQGQIEAFTNLHTPAKQVALFDAKSLKASRSRERTSYRDEGENSDKGSSLLGVPYVEGLQPFSPATLSLKELARKTSKSVNSSCSIEKARSADPSADNGPLKSGNSAVSPKNLGTANKGQEIAQAVLPNHENGVEFESLLDLSGSEKSFQYESAITKRFPNDIFLKKSPSIGQNESGSFPEVSAMDTFDLDVDREDANQSVWSVVATKHVVLDSTVETELDQSVW